MMWADALLTMRLACSTLQLNCNMQYLSVLHRLHHLLPVACAHFTCAGVQTLLPAIINSCIGPRLRAKTKTGPVSSTPHAKDAGLGPTDNAAAVDSYG